MQGKAVYMVKVNARYIVFINLDGKNHLLILHTLAAHY